MTADANANDERFDGATSELDNFDHPDHVLLLWVELANNAGLEASLTLTLPGGVVSGTIVGGATYFTRVGEALREGAQEESAATAIADLYERYAEEYRTRKDEENSAAAYIHLKDAWFHAPGTNPLPLGNWRGRLTMLAGWSLGAYAVPGSE